jgi:hypothetical protein
MSEKHLIQPGQYRDPSGVTITVIGVAQEIDQEGIGQSGDLYEAYENMSTLFHWNGDGTYCLSSSFAKEGGDRVFCYEGTRRVAIALDEFLVFKQIS